MVTDDRYREMYKKAYEENQRKNKSISDIIADFYVDRRPHCGAKKEQVMEKEKIQQKADDPLICACLTCQMARIRKIENDQKKTNQESK